MSRRPVHLGLSVLTDDWLASLGGDPQEHQHQPVGIEFPDLPGSGCVHKFHDGPTDGYSYCERNGAGSAVPPTLTPPLC